LEQELILSHPLNQLAADMGGAGFVFTPLESPAIHSGDGKDNIIFLLRRAEFNALSF